MAEESATFVDFQEAVLQEANQALHACMHAALVCSQQSQKIAAVAK